MPAAAPPNPIRVAAPAKLNLYLHILGRRTDGYHLLDSLIVFTDLRDSVTVRPSTRLSLRQEGPFASRLPVGDDNLVLRAARALAAAAGASQGAEIVLDKRIPVAAGLGGGSADAAATLKALVRLWKCDLPRDRLAGVALSLGADVPVCLDGRPAFVGGIGELIDPAPTLPEFGCVLVNPGVPLSTADVFRSREGDFSAPGRFSRSPVNARDLAGLLAATRNDLLAAARALAPEISAVLATLGADPACLLTRLSGSGATCFGLYESGRAARDATERLAGRGWWLHAGTVGAG